MNRLVILALIAGCTREHDVTLEIVASNGNVDPGYICSDSQGIPIFASALQGGSYHFRVLLDVFEISDSGGECEAQTLAGDCAITGCPDVATSCIDLVVSSPTTMQYDVGHAIDAALAAKSPLFTGLPRSAVSIRAVFALGACGDPGTPKVLGCGYTCPQSLENASTLDLQDEDAMGLEGSASSGACLTKVEQCASFTGEQMN